MTAQQQPHVPEGNPWSRIGWWSAAIAVSIAFVLGFVVLPRYQVDGPQLDSFAAICTALGLVSLERSPEQPQPDVRVSSHLAWTQETRAAISDGDRQNGAFVALNCTACHGEKGASNQTLIPTLAGMDAAVVYKQLDDYRNDKRLWGAMNGVAKALTDKDRADVATYLASLPGGLSKFDGVTVPESGRSLRQDDPTLRLVFAGDPQRGIPACAACHGPTGRKLGAPVLVGQHPEYIQRQLLSFTQGMRHNDINQQMRVIAAKLTAQEIQSITTYYDELSAEMANTR